MTKVCLGDVANERKENCKTNEYNEPRSPALQADSLPSEPHVY